MNTERKSFKVNRLLTDRMPAVITVYLTLILLLLLSLLTVTLESARTAGARYIAEAATKLSVDSVLADFCTPLFERYHIFGCQSMGANRKEASAYLSEQTENYITGNLQTDSAFLWKFSLSGLEVTETAMLTDYDGRLFRRQAVEYMQYRGTTLAAEKLLESLDLFEKADKTSALLKTKSGTEESLAEIDECVLELFELVDGICCNANGIRQTWKGKIRIAGNFVKKLLIGEPTMSSTGVYHGELFDTLKEHYCDPLTMITELESLGEQYLTCKGIIEDLSRQLDGLSDQGVNAEELPESGAESLAMETPEPIVNNSASPEDDILLEEKENQTLKERIRLKGELLLETVKAAGLSVQYSFQKQKIKSLVQGCIVAITEARYILGEIRIRQAIAESSVWEYEDQLMSAVEWLDQELYSELNSGLETMKEYIGDGVEGKERILDFKTMEQTLSKDQIVCEKIQEHLKHSIPLPEDETVWRETLRILQQDCKEYSFDGLDFDYSEMKLKSEGESPLGAANALFGWGLTEILIQNTDKLSDKKLTSQYLPSQMVSEAKTDNEEASKVASEEEKGLLSVFESEAPLQGIGDLTAKGASAIAEKILFLSYLTDHFSGYMKGCEESTVMEYELEYILSGKSTDRDALASVVVRILLVRTLFCLIHVLGDSEKCNTVQAFASGLLGFTGLPILILIMKYLVILVWAFEAAMVETAAILQGKKITLIPTKNSFQVGFEELLIMVKPVIQAKAESRPEDTGVKLGYTEYLLLFLLLQDETKQNMRTLDLMQENLALEDDGFRMNRVLYGFNITAEFLLPAVFLKLPFYRKREMQGFTYRIYSGALY